MKSTFYLSILLFVFGNITQAQSQTSVTTFPNLTGTDFSGTSYNLYTDLDAGKKAIVFFWGVNCGPCKGSLPYLQSLWETHGTNGDNSLVIYGFNAMGDATNSIQEVIDEYSLTFPIINAELPADWVDYSGLPAYNVICSDKSGEHSTGFGYPSAVIWWESILSGCDGIDHSNDLGILSMYDTEPKICGSSLDYIPRVRVSNSGSTNIQNFEIKTFLNGTYTATDTFSGVASEVPLYGFSDLALSSVEISSGDSISFEVICANDQVSSNNTNYVIIDPNPTPIPTSQSTSLILELNNADGNLNPSQIQLQVVNSEAVDPTNPFANVEYSAFPASSSTLNFTIPEGSCYSLEFLSGMAISEGTYVLKDNTGHVLWTVGSQGTVQGDGLSDGQRNKKYSRYFNVSASPLSIENHFSETNILHTEYYNLLGKRVVVNTLQRGMYIRKDVYDNGTFKTTKIYYNGFGGL